MIQSVLMPEGSLKSPDELVSTLLHVSPQGVIGVYLNWSFRLNPWFTTFILIAEEITCNLLLNFDC